jgi:hypothetical protein
MQVQIEPGWKKYWIRNSANPIFATGAFSENKKIPGNHLSAGKSDFLTPST